MIEMNITMALIIGVVLSLLFAEKTGIVPAGLVVPGYLALTMNNPAYVVSIFLVSFITFLVVTKIIAKFTIIYGRRKFAVMLITGIGLKLLFDLVVPMETVANSTLYEIGIIVPGLIANTIQRQGVLPTVASTLLLSVSTYSLFYVSTFI
ncbi:poly-gamma-glutamate biosynthesis protein PgsC [Aquibacillus albus]|uniref:Poly-gamma-glutamate biosynthesis protein PgsC/CapC n=1 Tax=Aquibacillus albus TaxID=1168171 RepID=A0ABS2MXY6_9BACI|nr:poly-gamma-glutamate biosynthesis protein PgsC [Aquibacillus albus]MBM7570752.1 poly-gamma-glutamate biosynthesis protein PgsC/CapC [Aquibacillus albus]